jgi:hypothetical protein
MAYDERDGRRGRGPGWRGDDSFGGGWGNQVPRPHRLGDRDWRGRSDEPDYGGEGYSAGGGWYGPGTADSDYLYGDPGRYHEAGEPRFGRAGIGGFGHDIGAAGMFGSSAREFAIARHDPHYADWRARQMTELDRDYDEYRRENQSRFDREFGAWREKRGEQRQAVGRVKEHMEVVGSDGGHVGTVDCTRGDRIVLTRSDEAAGGVHHMIPCAWIETVDDKVALAIDAGEARRRWQAENRSRALFEREDADRRGPHVLNRSFAGTYPDKE